MFPSAAHSDTAPDLDCHPTSLLKRHDPALLFDQEADLSENYILAMPDHLEYEAVLKHFQKVKAQYEKAIMFGEVPLVRPGLWKEV